MKNKIYNLIIVDESGSMGCLREATLSGINETIGTIRSAQNEFAETQEHFLKLVSFNAIANHADVRTLINCRPIGEIGEDFSDYHPHGCTPLYDAMGLSLIRLHEKVKDDKEASVVVTVLTDGLENASCEWRGADLRRLIEQLKEEGWSFSYLGSAHDVKSVSDPHDDHIRVQPDRRGDTGPQTPVRSRVPWSESYSRTRPLAQP